MRFQAVRQKERRQLVAAEIERPDDQRKVIEGSCDAVINLELHLKVWAFVRFEKEKLGTKQANAGKIVFHDTFNLFREAYVGKQ